jgi:hypothetical protein
MLILLAPDVVEAIMDGRQRAKLGVHVLREGFRVEWGDPKAVTADLVSVLGFCMPIDALRY